MNRADDNTPRPADQTQRDAALDPSRSFIVQAPAGSGKTDLLTKRYLRLLATVEHPEEVLAITFTKKAAAEMRQRILEALRDAGQPADSPHEQLTRELAYAVRRRDAERGWRIEAHPARLRIQTIDSLNAELTRQLPLLAKFGAQPRITETPEELCREAARRTLEALEDRETWADAIARLLQHLDNDWPRAQELLVSMLPRRDQWLPRLGDKPDRARLEAALAREVRHQLDLLRDSVPAEVTAELVELAAYAASRLHESGKESPLLACAGITALPDSDPAALDAWRGLAEMLLGTSGEWRKKPNVTQGFPPDGKAEKARIEALLLRLNENESLRVRLHAVRGLPAPVYNDTQWRLLEALTELLPLAVAQLQVVFGERGQVDFPEMAARALQALGAPEAPTDLALRLDYRIRHILVDEFQDTSLSQYKLLEMLTAGWTDGDGRTLFVVGDPMQSIYRFREAEVGLYLNARRQGLNGVRLQPLQLSANFRSQAGIVAWVNDTFAHVLPAREDIAGGAVPYAAATAQQPVLEESAVTVYPQFGHDPAREAQEVVKRVQDLRQRQPEASVAILVQGRNHLASIVPLLRLRDISFRAVEIEHLTRQPVVQDALALTRALLHPADRTAWLAMLRAPWCGLTLADLHALAAEQADALIPALLDDEKTLARLSADGRTRVRRVRKVLQDVLADRRRRPLREWVESAWLALGGPACARDVADLDDIQAYFTLLETLDEAGDLAEPAMLEERLQKLFAPPNPLGDANLQIMTIHKAKGLEFDHVVLPALGRAPRRDDPRLLLWLERPRPGGEADLLLAPLRPADERQDIVYEFVQRLDRERSHFEQGRLLYVAATRAKRTLHLFGHVNVGVDRKTGEEMLGNPRANSPLAQLWLVVREDFVRAFAAGRHHAARDDNARAQDVATAPLRRLPHDWQLPALPAGIAAAGLEAAAETEQTPVEFSWASEIARHIGTVVHRLLQRIAMEGLEYWDAARIATTKPVMEAMLSQLGLPDKQRKAALAQVVAALERTLADERGRWILDQRHAEAHSEYALATVQDGRLVTAVLDRTFVDTDGTRWIIDYKTGVHEGGREEEFLAREQERYRPQLERYAALLRELDGRPLRLGLYFPLLGAFREWAPGGKKGQD